MTRMWMLLLIAQLTLNTFGAQGDSASWARVEQLRLGQAVRVQCSGQQTWTGSFAGVSGDTLAMNVGGTERKAARSDVLRVEVKSRAKSTLIGLGIGAGAGAGVGFAAGRGSNLKSSEVTTAVALGTLLVAPVGAVIGALFPGWKTVYRGTSSGELPVR